MNEERFRRLMREAVGEAPASPWLNDVVRRRMAQPLQPGPSRAPVLALVAVFLALAVIAIAIAPRVLNHAASLTPGGTSTPKAVDPSNCSLPVILLDQPAGQPVVVSGGVLVSAQVHPGFVNTATGKFTIDRSASIAGMPVDAVAPQQFAGAFLNGLTPRSSYSATARHWVPVPPDQLSPDGRSYAYLVYLSAAQQPSGRSAFALMTYDIATRRSTRVWTAEFGISVIKWSTRGILIYADTGYHGGPYWMVNPYTGTAAPIQGPPAAPPQLIGVPPFDRGGGINRLGYTPAGDLIYSVSAQDRTALWVFYDTSDGRRVFIYKGPESGPTGFDPWTARADGTGIWFTTSPSPAAAWHWDESAGVRQFHIAVPVTGASQLQLVGACF